jgi:hypothetical protein
VVLTSAAYVHLKQADISKYTRNLAPASRAILLSGPAGNSAFTAEVNILSLLQTKVKTKFLLEELYQQMLAKALAHYFQAKLLLLDPTDFLIKVSLADTFSCSAQKFIGSSNAVCFLTDP